MRARDELRVAAWAKARALLTVERDAWAAAPYPSTREAWEAARRASEAARAAWAAACDLDRDARVVKARDELRVVVSYVGGVVDGRGTVDGRWHATAPMGRAEADRIAVATRRMGYHTTVWTARAVETIGLPEGPPRGCDCGAVACAAGVES